ncbi:histidine kinase N-terminal 7TM domain-containing protein [Acetivibrio cellulolyticus]|uniref:histidine kinase N-terminal 7TM domain-containing protein n=1 Tax=Acetivibrio cellulolyticus TaxID=35830 RepID=UPI0001E2F0D1|nr:histidine kinase N-terminal 7TM domain-containing protein [Acetivibrio cellulolyticus]
MNYNLLYFILPSISIVFSLSMILFSFMRGKKSPTLYSFIFCHVISTIWTLGQILENASTDEEQKWVATVIKYSAIIYMGAAWFTFTLLYTKRVIYLKKSLVLIFILPIAFNIAVLTNQYHCLFFSDYAFEAKTYGLIFWIHTVVSYLYLISSITLLLVTQFKSIEKYRIQYAFLAISILFPTVLNILYISKVIRPGTDFTPIGFAFSSFIFFVAVFKYRFLNILPVAITSILDAIPQIVVAIDSNNEINYSNKAFHSFLPQYKPSVQNNIAKFNEYLRKKVYIDEKNLLVLDRLASAGNEPFTGELEFKWPNLNKTIFFLINVIPIQERGASIGKVLIFSDVTEYKHLINENVQKNETLSLMAQKLLEANLFHNEAASICEDPRATK